MATQQQLIQQAQSTISMLEQLFRVKRVSEQELNQARDRLASLMIPASKETYREKPNAQPSAVLPPVVEPMGKAVEPDEYLALQSELSKDADRRNRQMAELSNQLHKVPTYVGCAELTRPILELKGQIESIWDKKRYLERNRCLPEEVADQEPQAENSPLKFELAYKKRRLVDLRSKLKDKLKNLAAKPGKVQEWREELARTNLEIAEIDIRLGTL